MKPCITWTQHKDPLGYGRKAITVDGKRTCGYVHRIAWERAYGLIPKGVQICHHCDNRACYEITHLYAGTAKTNSDDKLNRNRGRWAKGEEHGLAKLQEASVRYIRKALKQGLTKASLARRFGVSFTIISRIAKGTAWAHLK